MDTPNTIAQRQALGLAGLVTAGFQKVGEWLIDQTGSGILLHGTTDKRAGVYVYAVGGVVHYVGSAQRGLHGRFRRYAITKTVRTSARIRSEIVVCLSRGDPVEIYALQPALIDWNGLPVDLAAGLEEGLIRTLQPKWNIRSNPKVRP